MAGAFMMRLILLLLFAMVVSVALITFPNIADQALRIEAFGWLFETRQGAFIVALLVLIFLLWLLQRITGALFAGPGNIWRSLVTGSSKRNEKRLREALAQWLDQRGDLGEKALKRSRGVLPGWALVMLQTLITPARDLTMPDENEDPLVTALTARIVTDPNAHPKPDLATRKAHLEAWLDVHPDAPLALSRMADVAEEEEDWPKLVELLESAWKHGHCSSHSLKPRLARGYVALARHKPGQAMEYLRKSFRLCPENRDVVIALGQASANAGDTKTAVRIWTGHLEKNNDYEVAGLLLGLAEHDVLRIYRKYESRNEDELNHAYRWLRAQLAHKANLDGLAFEQMQSLAEQSHSSAAWQSLGDWHLAANDHEKAALCYQQALKSTDHSA
jgi:tetratricopeptide (TPR) repeat protein